MLPSGAEAVGSHGVQLTLTSGAGLTFTTTPPGEWPGGYMRPSGQSKRLLIQPLDVARDGVLAGL